MYKKGTTFILNSLGLLLVIGVLAGCGRDSLVKIRVHETAGLVRTLEYVKAGVNIPAKSLSGKAVFARDPSGTFIETQIVSNVKSGDTHELEVLFPVSLMANEEKVFELVLQPALSQKNNKALSVSGSGLDMMVSNEFYIADLSKMTDDNGRINGSGHLKRLILKEFNDLELVNRTRTIHWSPNLGREGVKVRALSQMDNPDTTGVQEGTYMLALHKKGFIEGYPEAEVSGTYRFYAGLPYFIFSSKIDFIYDAELTLLRNNEMTMTKVFTNMRAKIPDGRVIDLPLMEEAPIDSFNLADPLSDQVPWLYFYNKEKQYAFGFVQIEYDNRDAVGNEINMGNAYTHISRTGIYWDRVFFERPTSVPSGNSYFEKMAYVILNMDKEDPDKTIAHLYKCLANPLKVEYLDK